MEGVERVAMWVTLLTLSKGIDQGWQRWEEMGRDVLSSTPGGQGGAPGCLGRT